MSTKPLGPHPLAKLFPQIPQEDYAARKEDIRMGTGRTFRFRPSGNGGRKGEQVMLDKKASERQSTATESKDDGMETIIMRLKKEKADAEDRCYSVGFKNGLLDARRMNYTTLKQCGDLGVPVLSLMDPWSCLPEHIREGVEDELELAEDGADYGLDPESYAQGWLMAVKKFWTKVAVEI